MNLLFRGATRLLYVLMVAELSALPRPTDAPQAHGRGSDPDRVLLIGTGPVAGRGVLSHQLALPGRLATELSQITGRGADIDVVVNRRPGTAAVVSALSEIELLKYDAIVVTLSASHAFALTPAERWFKEMTALLKAVRDASLPDTAVIVTGIHPSASYTGRFPRLHGIVEQHARTLNHISQEACDLSDPAKFVGLPLSSSCVERDHLRSATYLEWALIIARDLAARLPPTRERAGADSPTARQLRGQVQPLADQQRALADLGVARTGSEIRFDRVVELARAYFGSQFAAFTLTDGHSDWVKSRSGFRGAPGITEFASATIAKGGPLVVSDAQTDERFTPATESQGLEIGFYAGYPVEAPDGCRIGVLSVFDRTPRITHTADSIMLRDLAMMIQRELWTQSDPILENA